MSFNDIINQNKAKSILKGQLASGRIAHAYLFLGQDGTGRKKTAIELAKSLNCSKNSSLKKFEDACDHCVSCRKIEHSNHPDVTVVDFTYQARLENKEVEKQKSLKIDTIRAMQKEISFKPSEGRWKVYIVEPAEKITLDAANCLLKTLEEPPSWTVIVLLGKHRENLPATVVSRTQVIYFAPLAESEIENYLVSSRATPRGRAAQIAASCEGSLSCALNLLEDNDDPAPALWKKIRSGNLCSADILFASQQLSKNARELLGGLINEAKNDFRSDCRAETGIAVEEISNSMKLIEQNVNPQMILDVLLLKLNNINKGVRAKG